MEEGEKGVRVKYLYFQWLSNYFNCRIKIVLNIRAEIHVSDCLWCANAAIEKIGTCRCTYVLNYPNIYFQRRFKLYPPRKIKGTSKSIRDLVLDAKDIPEESIQDFYRYRILDSENIFKWLEAYRAKKIILKYKKNVEKHGKKYGVGLVYKADIEEWHLTGCAHDCDCEVAMKNADTYFKEKYRSVQTPIRPDLTYLTDNCLPWLKSPLNTLIGILKPGIYLRKQKWYNPGFFVYKDEEKIIFSTFSLQKGLYFPFGQYCEQKSKNCSIIGFLIGFFDNYVSYNEDIISGYEYTYEYLFFINHSENTLVFENQYVLPSNGEFLLEENYEEDGTSTVMYTVVDDRFLICKEYDENWELCDESSYQPISLQSCLLKETYLRKRWTLFSFEFQIGSGTLTKRTQDSYIGEQDNILSNFPPQCQQLLTFKME